MSGLADEMGLRMADLIVVANSTDGMDPDTKMKIPAATVDECTKAEVDDDFREEPVTRWTKSILKAPNGENHQPHDDRMKRTVSWHDFEGKELHTVREFVPR